MTAYWFIILLPALMVLGYQEFIAAPGRSASAAPARPRVRIGLHLIAIILIWFIGLRYLVGCDWYNYVGISTRIAMGGTSTALNIIEPGYGLINLASERLGLGVYGANFVCGVLFVTGLVRFALRQPLPYLFVITAYPMLVITVAMGYTRQGAAIGLLMLAFNAFVDRKLLRYLVLVGAATLFHSTAIIFAPAAIFLGRRQLAIPAVAALFIVGTIGGTLLEARIQGLVQLYVVGDVYEGVSSAAIYRISLNGLAALVFVFLFKHWRRGYEDWFFYMVFLAISLTSFFAISLSPVAADRLALYFLPLQAAVFARLPAIVGRKAAWPVAAAVVVACAALMWVWFTFATHSSCWLPYRNLTLPEVW